MTLSPHEIVIDLERDAMLTDQGIETLNDRYMMAGEFSPQHAFARASAAFGDDLPHAQRLYDYVSKGWFMFATPLLSNGGTTRGLPISCYLNYVPDSREGILGHYEENGWLASLGGGIGGYWGDLRSVGTTTSHGSRTSGVIPFAKVVDSQMLAFNQGGCYLPGTRLLTENGWLDFRDVTTDMKVAQVTEDMRVEFVHPIEVVRQPFDGDMYHFHSKNGAVDIHVTDYHAMVVETMVKGEKEKVGSGRLTRRYAKDLKLHRDNRLHLAATYATDTEESLAPFERFLIAFQADGQGPVLGCTGVISGCLPVVFRFTKERKIEKLRALLAELNFESSEWVDVENATNIYVKVPLEYTLNKTFSWVNVSEFSSPKASEFLDELQFWDGKRRKNTIVYYTTIKENTDVVSALSVLANRNCRVVTEDRASSGRKTLHTAFIRDFHSPFGGDAVETTVYHYDGEVVCVEVPSGMILVEYNGSPLVCGNTRRGSYAGYLDISHPEIEEWLEMRRASGGDLNRKTLNLHHGVNVTDAFMEAVRANEDFPLVDPHSGEVRKTVSARALFRKLVETRHLTGEPYILFIDAVNRALPEPMKKRGLRVRSSNLCTEITLPVNENRTAVCCLSSVNLAKWNEWKHDLHFIEDLMRMLDNTLTVFIETAPDSMEKARYSAMRERSVGLGAMGFHSLLQQEGIPWESDLARGLNLMVFSHIEKSADAASVKLAEERGAAPDMKPLKNRFAHKTAIAPNASSSIFIPDGPISPSIEPNNTNAYLHKTLTGSHSIKNRELEKLLRSLGQDTKEVWSLIIEQKGSVQHLDFLTDKQKLVFKTSREIDQAWVVRHAADRQQFIDQAQSVNLFYPSEVDAGEMVEHHFMAWAQGLKSLYYVRATAARRAENTNSKVERRDVETQPEESDCLACEG